MNISFDLNKTNIKTIILIILLILNFISLSNGQILIWLISLIALIILCVIYLIQYFQKKKEEKETLNLSNNHEINNNNSSNQTLTNTNNTYINFNSSDTGTTAVILNEFRFGAKDLYKLPKLVNNCQLTYQCLVDVYDIDWNIANKCGNNKKFSVDCNEKGCIFNDLGKLGIIRSKNIIKKIINWKKRKFPIIIEISTACESQNKLSLRMGFYRDNYEYFKDREQIIVPLTGYSSDDCQLEIESINTGEVLSIEEDGYSANGDIRYAVYAADKIGRLNKKACNINAERGIDFIMFDHYEQSSSDKLIPYVTIFY